MRSFSNLSSFSDIISTDCVRWRSCLSCLICMDLILLLRLYASDIFTSRLLRYSRISKKSFVVLTCWNTLSSVASLLLVVELPSLFCFLSSYGLDSPLGSLFLEILLKYLLMLLTFFL